MPSRASPRRAVSGAPSGMTHAAHRSETRSRSGTINWDQVAGKWAQLKGSVRTEWGKLTDDDVDLVAGNREKLVGKLQERYGLTKDRALKSVDEFIAEL